LDPAFFEGRSISGLKAVECSIQKIKLPGNCLDLLVNERFVSDIDGLAGIPCPGLPRGRRPYHEWTGYHWIRAGQNGFGKACPGPESYHHLLLQLTVGIVLEQRNGAGFLARSGSVSHCNARAFTTVVTLPQFPIIRRQIFQRHCSPTGREYYLLWQN